MLESTVESKLKALVKRIGGQSYKWAGAKGVPDRIVLLPGGVVVFVEIKSSSGRLTELQQVVGERLKSLGCNYYVLRGAEGLEVFEQYLTSLMW